MFKRFYLAFLFLSLLFGVFAQQAGKISGVVRDKANGEPLPGVNVIVEESLLGASTDADGSYVILNVPPGTYTISFEYIGYQSIKVENVRVVPDITKRLDMDLSTTTIEIDEAITVVAEKPFFEAAATNTVRVLDAEEIERIPVRGINSIVSYNAGVVAADGSGGDTDNATINVRGGRGNETLFIVDGIPYNDVVFGNVTGTIPDAAIEQVSSQLGGFSAKYGSAQSGVINITTKSGAAKFYGGTDLVSSNITDDYNYNSATGFLGGPLFGKFSFFGSGEYIQTDDDRPRASGLVIPSAGIDLKARPGMGSDVTRFTTKVDGNFEKFKITFSSNGSYRNSRQYIHDYAKNASDHYPLIKENVLGGAMRFSHVVNPTTFWDITARAKNTYYRRGDGVWFEDLESYGDAEANALRGITLPQGDGSNVLVDSLGGVFYDKGRIFNLFQKYEINTYGLDFNMTKQFDNHLLEVGATVDQHQVRYYTNNPIDIAENVDSESEEIRYTKTVGVFYGYDIFGNEISNQNFRTVEGDMFEESAPKQPINAGAYIQDRIEFQDFILNLGVRWDYFEPDFDRIRDPNNIFSFGDNPNRLDVDDYEKAPSESYISPRLGFAFPMTEKTVFHAQYGIFRQAPRFFDIYDSWNNIDVIEQRDGQGQNNGHVQMERTTNYEFGFKQQFGNIASLDVTAYYRNVEGLINVTTVRSQFGQTTRTYISTVNQDFGTIKGMAFSFNLRRMGPVTTKIDYALSLSEGTGSDPSSSRVATFRNPNNAVPLAIAPLDFDQRHTFTASLDIRSGNDEGPNIFGSKLLENSGATFLINYNSGRPYTPLETANPLTDNSQYGNTTQYVNSALAGSLFRIDLRVDKDIRIGNFSITPYLWIQNLLDRDNFVDVWPSTGKPDDSGYLNTPEGEQLVRSTSPSSPDFVSDFKALERDPENYGLPRIIRLGLKAKF
ncbi:MAG: carboxypeptidase-like regulatory domain-containing protein [Calditrichia bacterium]